RRRVRRRDRPPGADAAARGSTAQGRGRTARAHRAAPAARRARPAVLNLGLGLRLRLAARARPLHRCDMTVAVLVSALAMSVIVALRYFAASGLFAWLTRRRHPGLYAGLAGQIRREIGWSLVSAAI